MNHENYPIYDVSEEDIDGYEQMGTKSKFWYTDSFSEDEYLFKSIHTQDASSNPVVREGEDWAEKIACEIAELLDIPHAEYDLAFYQQERGIRSKKFTSTDDNMHFGNELIERTVRLDKLPYDKGQCSQEVERVAVILQKIIKNPPQTWNPTDRIKTSFDVFIGYLMLDTLISNQDRHNENWAMIVTRDHQVFLAPSFDHAASLGRNESHEKMIDRLESRDKLRQIPNYVKRSKSHFYKNKVRLKTIEAFIEFGGYRKNAALAWLEKLESIDFNKFEFVVNKIPDRIMTETQKAFSLGVLSANKERLINSKLLFQR